MQTLNTLFSNKFFIAIWSVLSAVPKICTFYAVMQLLSCFSQLSIPYNLTFCGLQPEFMILNFIQKKGHTHTKIIKDNFFPVTTV